MNYPFNPLFGLPSKLTPAVPIICKDFISCLLLVFDVVLRILTWISGALAVIMFMYAGITLIVSYKKAEEVKNILIWGTIGLVIALISYALVVLIENVVSRGAIGMVNIAYAQQLRFQPGRVCTPYNIFDILSGKPIPQGLLGKCLLWLAQKILTVIYTVSLLLAIGFIIYGGMILITKPGDRSGMQYVLWSIIGAVVTILAFSLVRAIEYSLTH
ncbi:MAG: hypothetical protein ACO2O4_02155 [Minisyncoccia bacterium]|jgi:uncharacterized membrane protein YjfL (UPF0719 family)